MKAGKWGKDFSVIFEGGVDKNNNCPRVLKQLSNVVNCYELILIMKELGGLIYGEDLVQSPIMAL